MSMISVFSTIVLVTTIATLILALAAYFAYKVREWRRPKSSTGNNDQTEKSFEPIFLKRHKPDDLTNIPEDEHLIDSK